MSGIIIGIIGISATTDMSCNFETPALPTCFWINGVNGANQWARDEGETPSFSTGPSSAKEGNYYLYLEATNVVVGAEFELISPIVSLPTRGTLRFWYHMWGASMGDLYVKVQVNNVDTWFWVGATISGNQGNNWLKANVILPADVTRVKIVGKRGTDYTSDIAIDDISYDRFIAYRAEEFTISNTIAPNCGQFLGRFASRPQNPTTWCSWVKDIDFCPFDAIRLYTRAPESLTDNQPTLPICSGNLYEWESNEGTKCHVISETDPDPRCNEVDNSSLSGHDVCYQCGSCTKNDAARIFVDSLLVWSQVHRFPQCKDVGSCEEIIELGGTYIDNHLINLPPSQKTYHYRSSNRR